MANKAVQDLPIAQSINYDNDRIVGVASGVVSQIRINSLLNMSKSWSSITDKPFNDFDTMFFATNGGGELTLLESVSNSLHKHNNKLTLDKLGETSDGKLMFNGREFTVSSNWTDVIDKPFNDYNTDDFEIINDELNIKNTIKADFHNHNNLETLNGFSVSESKLLWNNNPIAGEYDLPIASSNTLGGIKIGEGLAIDDDGVLSTTNQGGGIDFSALANAMTTGVLSGITIEANTENENFNFTVDGIPDVEINTTAIEGGNQVTFSAKKGEEVVSEKTIEVMNGRDGISPTITSEKIGSINTVTFTYGESQTELIKISDGEVDVKAVSYVADINVPLSGWNDSAPYTQTINITSVTSESSPIIDILLSENQSNWNTEIESYSCLNLVETSDGQITLYCVNEKPKSDFKIQMRIFGDATGEAYVTQDEFNDLKELISGLNTRLENVLNGGID